MNCSNCGAPAAPGQQFCSCCGAPLGGGNACYSAPPTQSYDIDEASLPPQYRPLSPWAYFGYALLFTLPIVGLVLLIVFSFSDENINRRNFARSYWCALLVAVIVIVIVAVLALALGFSLLGYDYF